MAYTVNLSGNQQLMIVNQGTRTLITLFSSSDQQQQSQSSGINTGNWTSPPQLYQTGAGFILQLNGDRGQQYVSIQANSINVITECLASGEIANPGLNNAAQVNLENVPDEIASSNEIEFEPMQPMQPMKPMQPMPSMKPMKPMKMGNMSMNMNPMSMQMGNMSMNMGESAKSTSTKNFCSQCGEKVKQSDRFCSSCGNKLDN